MIINHVLCIIFTFVIFLFLRRLDKAMSSLGKSVDQLSESVDQLNESVHQLSKVMFYINLGLIKSGSLNKDDKEKMLWGLLELMVVAYPGYFLMLSTKPWIKALPLPKSMIQKGLNAKSVLS